MDSRFQAKRWWSTGVWPLGAQVARTDGSKETPESSSNTISACWAVRFFQLWPALVDPALDGFLVAFDCAPSRPLPAPAQLVAQDVPDVAGVIRDAGDPLDDLGHTRQGPHIGRITVGFGTFGQRLCHPGQLRLGQPGVWSHTASRAQCRSATLAPRLAPLGHDLVRHAQLPS